MRIRSLLAPLAAAALLGAMAGCTPATDEAPQPNDGGEQASSTIAGDAEAILADHDLAGLDGRGLVDRLEATPVAERSTELFASIRPEAVLLTGADGAEAAVPLPADEFYVSVAPYVDQTHECFFHSLTTCLGELPDEAFEATFTSDDGDVLLEETVRTQDNGFVGLWLPRGVTGTLTLSGDAGDVTLPLGTGPDDPTCVTTAQLT